MNPMRFFWGLVIAGSGILLIGVNLGWWNADIWSLIWYLWPLIFIVLGLRFLINNDAIFMGIVLILVLLSGYIAIKKPENIINKFEAGNELLSQNLEEKFSKGDLDEIKLKLDLGASKVNIGSLNEEDNSTNLYKLETKNYGKIESERQDKDKIASVSISEKFVKGIINSRISKREFSVKLNNQLKTNLELNSGASSLNMDLSKIKLKNLKIDAGASNAEIRFGNLISLTEAKIDTGASKMIFFIPKGSGLKVIFDSDGLNKKDFAGNLNLTKADDDTYISSDYEKAANKININIQAGVSTIEINQY
jgi:hypothetical protein